MRCFCAKNYDLAIFELAQSFPLLYFVRLCRFVIRYLSHRETVDLIYEMNLKLRGSVKNPSFVNKCVKVSAYSPLDFKACVVVRVLKKLNHIYVYLLQHQTLVYGTPPQYSWCGEGGLLCGGVWRSICQIIFPWCQRKIFKLYSQGNLFFLMHFKLQYLPGSEFNFKAKWSTKMYNTRQ